MSMHMIFSPGTNNSSNKLIWILRTLLRQRCKKLIKATMPILVLVTPLKYLLYRLLVYSFFESFLLNENLFKSLVLVLLSFDCFCVVSFSVFNVSNDSILILNDSMNGKDNQLKVL